jgi:hypothetical protein
MNYISLYPVLFYKVTLSKFHYIVARGTEYKDVQI